MRIRTMLLVCLSAFVACWPLMAQKASKEARAKLPRVAILEFKAAPDTWHGWGRYGGWGNHMSTISNQLRDLFVTELSEQGRGKLRMIERERLEEVRGELAFQQSGEVDTATVQRVGKLLGVQYMITGKVTRFAFKESKVGTGWAVGALVGRLTGSGIAGDIAGNVKLQKASFSGRLDVRLIEVETGEILGAWKDEGQVGDMGLKVAGTGNELEYNEELVNKVFEPVVARIAPKIVALVAQEGGEP